MITKTKLEELAEKYETVDFIKNDPVKFPHRFQKIEDIEIAAFLSSIIAFGSRKAFIEKLEMLFELMDSKPYEFIVNFEPYQLKDFNYRMFKNSDMAGVLQVLKKLYTQDGGLRKLFEYGYQRDNTIQTMLQTVTDYFYSNVKNAGRGFYNMIPNPKNKGPMKKMNLFLRWMVRKGPVDLGIWDFIPKDELLIPLDLHVSRISREMGLLTRKADDFKAVLELSKKLKEFDAQDPVRFDFAIFGLGVNEF